MRAFSLLAERNALNNNHMGGGNGVLSPGAFFGATSQTPEAQRVTRRAGVFFTMLFFILASSRLSSAIRGRTAGRHRFAFLWLARYFFMYSGFRCFQVFWLSCTALGTEDPCQFLAVVVVAAATLAVGLTANHLLRMAAQRLELLAGNTDMFCLRI